MYPDLKEWNTGRNNSFSVIATAVGFSIGLNLYESNIESYGTSVYDASLLIDFFGFFGFLFVRTLFGLLSLVISKYLLKSVLLKCLYLLYNLDGRDTRSAQTNKVELPFYFIIYLFLGIMITYVLPLVFKIFNLS
jgi:hypothetical protein